VSGHLPSDNATSSSISEQVRSPEGTVTTSSGSHFVSTVSKSEELTETVVIESNHLDVATVSTTTDNAATCSQTPAHSFALDSNLGK